MNWERLYVSEVISRRKKTEVMLELFGLIVLSCLLRWCYCFHLPNDHSQSETPWQLFFFQFKKKRKYNNDISGENKKQKQLFNKKLHMFTKSQMCQTRCHMRSTLNSSFGMEILIKCLWREHWISPGYDIVAVYLNFAIKYTKSEYFSSQLLLKWSQKYYMT